MEVVVVSMAWYGGFQVARHDGSHQLMEKTTKKRREMRPLYVATAAALTREGFVVEGLVVAPAEDVEAQGTVAEGFMRKAFMEARKWQQR